MRARKLLISIISALAIYGCASTPVGSMYLKGYAREHSVPEIIASHDTLHYIEGKSDGSGLICRHFINLNNGDRYFFLQRDEAISGDTLLITTDTLKIGQLSPGSFVMIGSREFDKVEESMNRSGYVISVECCKELGTPYPSKSDRILLLHANLDGSDKFTQLNPSEYIRYNEGYYRRTDN